MHSPHDPIGGMGRDRARSMRFAQLAVWCILGLLAALALAATAAVTNPSSSFPITVDGAAPPTEYGTAGSLGFTSGSLYSDNNGNNASTYVVTNNLTGHVGELWFVGKIESANITADTYADQQTIGTISLSVLRLVNNVPEIDATTLTITKSPGAFSYNVSLLGPSGAVSGTPTQFGMLMATSMTTGNGDNSFPGKPALVTEFAIPLQASVGTTYPIIYPADGNPYRISCQYVDPNHANKTLQIVDGYVTLAPPNQNDTHYEAKNDAFFVPQHVDVILGNVGNFDPTKKNGTVQVVVNMPANPTVSDLDVQKALANGTISIRDYGRSPISEAGLDFLAQNGIDPGTFYTSGTHPLTKYTLRVNTSGVQQLVLFFSVPALANTQGNPFYWGTDTDHVELAGVIGGFHFASKTDITVSAK